MPVVPEVTKTHSVPTRLAGLAFVGVIEGSQKTCRESPSAASGGAPSSTTAASICAAATIAEQMGSFDVRRQNHHTAGNAIQFDQRQVRR